MRACVHACMHAGMYTFRPQTMYVCKHAQFLEMFHIKPHRNAHAIMYGNTWKTDHVKRPAFFSRKNLVALKRAVV